MPDKTEELKKWIKTYLKSRGIQIVHMEERENSIFVEYIEKKHLYLVYPELKEISPIMEQLESKEHSVTVVTLNTEKNLSQLIVHWDILAQYSLLNFFFVVPSANEKWAIFPFSHEKIAERKFLEKGLRALAEGVGFIQ